MISILEEKRLWFSLNFGADGTTFNELRSERKISAHGSYQRIISPSKKINSYINGVDKLVIRPPQKTLNN